MEKPGREELAERFMESMGVIMRARSNAFRRTAGQQGVSMPQLFLLKMAGMQGEPTLTSLAQAMMVAAPTASRMVENLCAKGLLERRRDESNRRVTRIRLTRKGRQVLCRMWELQKAELLAVLEEEEADSLEAMVRCMERIAGRLTETVKEREESEKRCGGEARGVGRKTGVSRSPEKSAKRRWRLEKKVVDL